MPHHLQPLSVILILVMAMIAMPTQHNAATTKQTVSNESFKSPEIRELESKITTLEAKQSTREKVLVFFIALTAIAALGVFISDFLSRRVGKQLEIAQSALIAAKDRELATELGNKDVEIGKAQKAAGDANREAGHANERAANAEKEAARLNKEAEQERLARVKLEERLAPRRITEEQIRTLVTALAPLRGTGLVMGAIGQDAETSQFANLLAQALGRAGINIPAINTLMIAGPIQPGLAIVFDPNTQSIHAIALRQALVNSGIAEDVRLIPNSNPANRIELNVGPK